MREPEPGTPIEVSCSGEQALCDCRSAVARAHGAMLLSGVEPTHALEVAVRLFSYHHPEIALAEARTRVQRWLGVALLH